MPPKPPRANSAVSVRDALAAAIEWSGITDEVRAQRLFDNWADAVGAANATHSRPRELRGRVLDVDVASSAWLHELSLVRDKLLARALAYCGEPKLFETIRLHLADRRPAPPQPRPRGVVRKPQPVVEPVPATGGAREQILRETAAVADPDLRELIARVRIDNDK